MFGMSGGLFKKLLNPMNIGHGINNAMGHMGRAMTHPPNPMRMFNGVPQPPNPMRLFNAGGGQPQPQMNPQPNQMMNQTVPIPGPTPDMNEVQAPRRAIDYMGRGGFAGGRMRMG